MAYEVQNPTERERLQAYETSYYKPRPYLIHLPDGRKIIGTTFIWDADTALLKEGAFDLKDWQMTSRDGDGI
jgi:hypothetical protein